MAAALAIAHANGQGLKVKVVDTSLVSRLSILECDTALCYRLQRAHL
ncbi:MAG: hypothetical protein R3F08_00315 [Dokdonella sp.]|nr:hypothetical protein [Dokdonella sp.]